MNKMVSHSNISGLGRHNHTAKVHKASQSSSAVDSGEADEFTPTAEFYQSRFKVVSFFRGLEVLLVSVLSFVVFVSPKIQRGDDVLDKLLDLDAFLRERFLLLLQFYRKCPLVLHLATLFRGESGKIFRLVAKTFPQYKSKLSFIYSYNTINFWLSGFVFFTFFFLYELFVNFVDNLVLWYESKMANTYCTNMIHPSRFHDKEFTEREVSKLLHSSEYLDLKARRFGLGPEAWNWQLRKSIYGSANRAPSQSTNDSTDHESDLE
ncbi:hypothetical protein BEWA_024970 [Theileria equi strain WA]|uniref:Uncharacterized protein n=1 Tax=Theileria equi strain WA TaxID=1537102 RepID=L0AWL3_THEEQ|nr:hypothetical protein BEWA_024970 [Theileria equi strain WA]AFZ79648.1 hypothetical protein BEWA_024970 [Theileria equi strain WA]|eukprot:XP_004829314.1 hypothetical protein BEWA_024970 [Theileria equi strain WA]